MIRNASSARGARCGEVNNDSTKTEAGAGAVPSGLEEKDRRDHHDQGMPAVREGSQIDLAWRSDLPVL